MYLAGDSTSNDQREIQKDWSLQILRERTISSSAFQGGWAVVEGIRRREGSSCNANAVTIMNN
jgi:hypothetical protein